LAQSRFGPGIDRLRGWGRERTQLPIHPPWPRALVAEISGDNAERHSAEIRAEITRASLVDPDYERIDVDEDGKETLIPPVRRG
jgi:hypothetical protein